MYDYVIVGAGSAGCVLANRLSEDPDVSVLLLEAGPPDVKDNIHVPLGLLKLGKTDVDWDYSTAPEPFCDARRIYLPREDLSRFGVTEDDIAGERVTNGFCALVRFEAERTRALYAHADEGFAFIPAEARLPIRLARVLYARILDKIEQNRCDVFTRRARVPTWEKLVTLARERAALAPNVGPPAPPSPGT